jgi:hypothetical protein
VVATTVVCWAKKRNETREKALAAFKAKEQQKKADKAAAERAQFELVRATTHALAPRFLLLAKLPRLT